jgi:hypothetical protein
MARVRAAWLLGTFVFVWSTRGDVQTQSPARISDAIFLATLGELREGGFADEEAIVERLNASVHPSMRTVPCRPPCSTIVRSAALKTSRS